MFNVVNKWLIYILTLIANVKFFQACPKPDCNKKVTEGNMGYHCEKCNQTSPDFKWRLMLQTCIADWSGCLWFTCFQDQAEALLKRKADEIGSLKDKVMIVTCIVHNSQVT